MAEKDSKILLALATCLLLVVWAGFAQAANGPTHRPGKVIIIRGAFTVFSLGMNELGDKLRQYGLDVEVVADVSAGRAVAKLASEYQRNPNLGPIVLVGHSRGAELGPKEARTLQQHGIPVKLIVMVDAVHKTSIPANVQRCVNLFQTAAFSLPHGTPATADSRKTKLVNANIAKLKTRRQGGSINHFNMDASPWIHKLVMSEVLRACPVGGPTAPSGLVRQVPRTVRPSTAAPAQSPTKSPVARSKVPKKPASSATQQARRSSPSGFQHPPSMASGLWADEASGDEQASQSNLWSQNGKELATERPAARSGRLMLRSGSGSRVRTSPRTAARPETTPDEAADSDDTSSTSSKQTEAQSESTPSESTPSESTQSEPTPSEPTLSEPTLAAPKTKEPTLAEPAPKADESKKAETTKPDRAEEPAPSAQQPATSAEAKTKKTKPIQIQVAG